MKKAYSDEWTQMYVGDALACAKALPEKSVHCIVTSPPYWGLRSYLPADALEKALELGAERTPEEYVEKLVAVFRALRRVLRDDGTLWLNLGDSYAAGPPGNLKPRSERGNGAGLMRLPDEKHYVARKTADKTKVSGLKSKDLVGIPWMVAFALRADGWYLRSDIIWNKPNPMPECLDPSIKVFVRSPYSSLLVKHVTLDDVLEGGEPYPQILTPTGWRQIKEVWETAKPEAISFEAAKVSKILCSPEHLWPVSHDRRRAVTHDIPAAELRDEGYKDYLLHHTIEEWLEGSDDTLFGSALDYDLGWLVGLYAAEGGFGEARGHRCKLTLHKDETDLAERVEAITASKFGSTVSRRQIANYLTLRFSDPDWHRLAAHIVLGKSTNKELNLTAILNAPRLFRQGVWDGYIAGDGSVRKGGGVIAASASQRLRDDVAVLASSIGIVTSKGTYRQKDERTGKTYTSHQVWTPYATKRKRKGATTARQLTIRNKRTVAGPHRMIDLEVEGGLFLINDGIVTHNSVTDRPTKSHEYLFLLTKKPTYYFDQDAVREPNETTWKYVPNKSRKQHHEAPQRPIRDGLPRMGDNPAGRNRRSVWTISTRPYPGSHYAVMPPDLVYPCIKAGSSEYGVCSSCLAPWERMVERTKYEPSEVEAGVRNVDQSRGDKTRKLNGKSKEWQESAQSRTVGWRPSCSCHSSEELARLNGTATIPATVLDPFAGSGTTLYAARKLGRKSVGFDLDARNVKLVEGRLGTQGVLL